MTPTDTQPKGDKTMTNKYVLTEKLLLTICREYVAFLEADKTDPYMTESFSDYVKRKYGKYTEQPND